MVKKVTRGGKKFKKIAICTSASFYKEALEIEKELRKLGFKVALPSTAYTMRKTKNYDPLFYKKWYRDHSAYKRKAYLIKNHFQKIISSDAILVINLEKNAKKGYIGGNVLMEMGIGFHYNKPVFILNEINSESSFYEEIMGMEAIFLQGDLSKIVSLNKS